MAGSAHNAGVGGLDQSLIRRVLRNCGAPARRMDIQEWLENVVVAIVVYVIIAAIVALSMHNP
jgi:hypothetical protein